jgi:uncharacterized protein (TIGR02271 family)
MITDKSQVRVGMRAISNRGENLGRVLSRGDQGFIIEKGVFFPKDYLLRYEYITDIRGDQVIYALDDLRVAERSATKPVVDAASVGAVPEPPRRVAAAPAAAAADVRAGTGAAVGRRRGADLDADQELRVPLRDEEMTVEKVSRETGHVRIHKSVRVEEKHISVPVRREELVVEHLPPSQARASGAVGDDLFQEGTIDVTLHEEEIHVSKRPVIREELRVRKVAHEEQRDASASLRHEEAQIQDTTSPRHAGTRR